jgi:phosphoribosylamine--glycine ligase
MTSADREKEIEIVQRIFKKLKGKGSNPGLRGIPTYTAFVHTADGQKIFENNSRPGDPEIMNLLPILKEDFVDLCFKIISGNLKHIRFEKKSTVVMYKVPLTYGGYKDVFSGLTTTEEATESVDLSKVNRFVKNHEDQARVYPGSMEIRDDRTYALKSRAVATVGIGDDLESARNNSLEAIQMIRGGSLWYRNDIASKKHIERSIEHMKKLRGN